MEDDKKIIKDRSLKYDERQLFIEGILLKLIHDFERINQYLESIIKKELKPNRMRP